MAHGTLSCLDSSCLLVGGVGWLHEAVALLIVVNHILLASLKVVTWVLKSLYQSLQGFLGNPKELSNSALL